MSRRRVIGKRFIGKGIKTYPLKDEVDDITNNIRHLNIKSNSNLKDEQISNPTNNVSVHQKLKLTEPRFLKQKKKENRNNIKLVF